MVVKQRQSQKQNVNVNINLGEKKKKRKPRKRKTGKKEVKQTRIIPAFNPPSIINFPPSFNQQPAVNLPPPPIQQKQYSVFPEGETATALNLLSNVPVPLQVEGSPVKELLKPVKTTKKEKITVLSSEEFAPAGGEQFAPVEEENVFKASTEPAPPPSFAQPAPELTAVGGEAQPFSAEDIASYKALTESYKQADIPKPAQQPTLRQHELRANLGARFKAKKLKEQKEQRLKAEKQRLKIEQLIPSLERGQLYAPSQLYLEPEEPPSPTASTISSLSGGFTSLPEGVTFPLQPLQLGEIATPLKDVFGLSKISQQTGPLPPIGQSQPPLTSSGLTTSTESSTSTKSSNISPEFTFYEGGSASAVIPAPPPAPPPIPATEKLVKKRGGQKVKEEERLKKETITGITTGKAPVIEVEKPKRKPKQTKEAFNPQQSALAFPQPVVTAEAIPVELTAQGAVSLSAPLSQQPTAQFLGGSEKTFSLAPPPPAKAGETLQRQRRVIERATALTPAEQNILLNP